MTKCEFLYSLLIIIGLLFCYKFLLGLEAYTLFFLQISGHLAIEKKNCAYDPKVKHYAAFTLCTLETVGKDECQIKEARIFDVIYDGKILHRTD